MPSFALRLAARSRLSGFPTRRRPGSRALRPHRLACRSGALGGSAARRGTPGLARHRLWRCGASRFVFKNPRDGAADTRSPASFALTLTDFIGIFGASSGAFLGSALARWRKGDPSAPGLGKTDRNDLLRRPCPVLAMANLADLFAHELSCLRGGRFAGALSS